MFITFEGIEGVGKTTQLKSAAERLTLAGIPNLVTREPGGTEMGEEIRDILLAHRNEPVIPMTELLLMFAARVQHVATVIQPALTKGYWVLCDRFVDASYAYQGGGRGISMKDIGILEQLTLGDFRSDHVFLFDAPVMVGLNRVKGRGIAHDRFEQEKTEFFERIRNAYLMRAKKEVNRYSLIDATKSMTEIQNSVSNIIQHLIEQYEHQKLA